MTALPSCTRCGERPRRAPSQRWCRRCHAADMAARRARARDVRYRTLAQQVAQAVR